MNSRSICGVSQTAHSRSATAPRLRAGSPSSRNTRRPLPAACPAPSEAMPVPISKPSSPWASRAATAQLRLPWRGRSASRAPLSPRPGTSSDSASSRLVLPLPFGPVSTLIRPSGPASAGRQTRCS